jgi:hypothetical protein
MARAEPTSELAMKTNVGNIDRTIRVIAGLAILSLFFILEGDMRWFALVGLVPLATATMRWCPAYTLIGVNTCPVDKRG